jgi:RNA polymerase sigma factor (sigma-70 family)
MSVIPFQQVLDAHRDAVWRVCVAVAGRDEAEDAFQETWLAALRAYPRLEPGANVRAWLLTIAQRKAIDVHRGRARRPLVSDRLPEPQAAPPAEPDDALWAAVRELPPTARRSRCASPATCARSRSRTCSASAPTPSAAGSPTA